MDRKRTSKQAKRLTPGAKSALPASFVIHVSKVNQVMSDPSGSTEIPPPELGYGDLYTFRLAPGNGAAAGRGHHVPHGASITWNCDQPFTLFVPDKSHWQTTTNWTDLPLWDGQRFSVFSAMNSVAAQPPLTGFSRELTVVGNANDNREYTILIPQIDLTRVCIPAGYRLLRACANSVPPGNALVRATLILQ